MGIGEGVRAWSITERVIAYIESEGCDFDALAATAGLNNDDLNAIVAGKRSLAAEEYVAICESLRLPLSQFVTPEDGLQQGHAGPSSVSCSEARGATELHSHLPDMCEEKG